jgi:hypothetical protein
MKRRVRPYRSSQAGGALVLVLAAAVIVLAVGPKHDQVPAFVVIGVVVAMLVMPDGGRRFGIGRSNEERRAGHPETDRVREAEEANVSAEGPAWERQQPRT